MREVCEMDRTASGHMLGWKDVVCSGHVSKRFVVCVTQLQFTRALLCPIGRTQQTSFVSGIPGCPGVSEVKPFLATSPPGNRAPFLATSPPGNRPVSCDVIFGGVPVTTLFSIKQTRHWYISPHSPRFEKMILRERSRTFFFCGKGPRTCGCTSDHYSLYKTYSALVHQPPLTPGLKSDFFGKTPKPAPPRKMH